MNMYTNKTLVTRILFEIYKKKNMSSVAPHEYIYKLLEDNSSKNTLNTVMSNTLHACFWKHKYH